MFIKDLLSCAYEKTLINVYRYNEDEKEYPKEEILYIFVTVGTPNETNAFKDIMNSKIKYFKAVDHNTLCVYID